MTEIAARLTATMDRAGINPRTLSAVTQIHYTTIYAIKKREDNNSYPVVVKTLTDALDTLDELLNNGELPFKEKLTNEAKAERLKTLFNKYNSRG